MAIETALERQTLLRHVLDDALQRRDFALVASAVGAAKRHTLAARAVVPAATAEPTAGGFRSRRGRGRRVRVRPRGDALETSSDGWFASLARANNLGVSRKLRRERRGRRSKGGERRRRGLRPGLERGDERGGSSSSIGATPPDDVVRVVGASSSAFGIVPGSGLGVDSRARSGSRSRVVFGRWSSARAAYADARGVVGRFRRRGRGARKRGDGRRSVPRGCQRRDRRGDPGRGCRERGEGEAATRGGRGRRRREGGGGGWRRGRANGRRRRDWRARRFRRGRGVGFVRLGALERLELRPALRRRRRLTRHRARIRARDAARDPIARATALADSLARHRARSCGNGNSATTLVVVALVRTTNEVPALPRPRRPPRARGSEDGGSQPRPASLRGGGYRQRRGRRPAGQVRDDPRARHRAASPQGARAREFVPPRRSARPARF